MADSAIILYLECLKGIISHLENEVNVTLIKKLIEKFVKNLF